MESPFRASDLTDPALRLIETFAWDGAAFPRLDRHLARMGASAAALGFAFDEAAARAALAPIGGATPLRVRLTLDRAGRAEAATAPLPPAAPFWRIRLAPERLDAADPWLRHKTTRRALYDRTRAALPEGIHEAIFANREGLLCEGTITTLFFDLGAGLRTPPLACGCLPGILRAELLAAGRAAEEPLPLDALPRARLWAGNALRGLIPASLRPDPAPGRGRAPA